MARPFREPIPSVKPPAFFGLPARRTPLRISPDNPNVTRVGQMTIRPKAPGEEAEDVHFYRLNWVPGLSPFHRLSRVRAARRDERAAPFAQETRDVAAGLLNQLRYFDPHSRQSVSVLRLALAETLRKQGKPLRPRQGNYTVLFGLSAKTGQVASLRLTYNFRDRQQHDAFSEYRLTSDAYRRRGVAGAMDEHWKKMMTEQGVHFDFGEIRPITANHFEKMDALRAKIAHSETSESERKSLQKELNRMQDELDHLHFFDKLGYRLINPGKLHYFHTYSADQEGFEKEPENAAHYGTPYILMARPLADRSLTPDAVRQHLETTYGPHYYDAGRLGEKINEKNRPVLKEGLRFVKPTEMIRLALEDYERRKAGKQTGQGPAAKKAA